MEDTALQIVSHYGYWAIAILLAGGIIGLPVPDELILMFCGYLVFSEELHFLSTIVWCFCGSITGMTVSYILGAKFGLIALNKFGKYFGMKEKHLNMAQAWFQRFGPFTILIGYYIPGIRQLTAFSSAVGRIPYWKFLLFAIPGGLLWVILFVKIGIYIGYSWTHFRGLYHHYHYLILACIFIAAILMGIWFYKYYYQSYVEKNENEKDNPPSSASD